MTVSVDTTKTGDQGSLFSTLAIQAGGVLAMAAGSTFNLYNTADQTTNYERLRADWSTNVARIFTQFGGSATSRRLTLGAANTAGGNPAAALDIRADAFPFHRFYGFATNSTASVGAFSIDSPNLVASAGVQYGVTILPTINQSGTAGYTALDINPTETATGSGTKLLQRWAVGGSAQAQMNAAGTLWLSYVAAIHNIGFTNSIGSANDVTLTRDAADTLALRRDTNAQTFRVYNTYTDASNYECGNIGWSGGILYIGASAAGTGTQRATYVFGNSVTIQSGTGPTSRWAVNTSGHFLAVIDNAYDIGASGVNRPKNIYAGTDVRAAAKLVGLYTQHTATLTVATLPAAGGNSYTRAFVSDSTVAAAGNFGNIVAGGGANIVPVFSDGTNWRIG